MFTQACELRVAGGWGETGVGIGGLKADCREGAEQNGCAVEGFAPTSRAHPLRDGELGKDRWQLSTGYDARNLELPLEEGAWWSASCWIAPGICWELAVFPLYLHGSGFRRVVNRQLKIVAKTSHSEKLSYRLGNDEIWVTERQSQYGDVVLLAKLLRSLGDRLR